MGSARAGRLLAFGWALVSASTSAFARGEPEDPPISADRPGFLFAPTVMPRGRLQFETGPLTLSLAHESGGEARIWSVPVDVRYGLTETFELRASLPTWNDLHDDTGPSTIDATGFGDSVVGFKLQLPELHGGPLALQASLQLPTGEDPFTTDVVGGSAYLLYGRDLSATNVLQTMIGATYTPIEGADDQTGGSIGALVSHAFTDQWSTYVEGTALPGLKNLSAQSYAGVGLVWTRTRDMQLDLSSDFGLGDASADVIASIGVSWRL